MCSLQDPHPRDHRPERPAAHRPVRENHVQELCANYEAGAYCGKPVHFIGHLQTNKIKKVLGKASLIQSVDSERLVLALEKEAAKLDLVQDILLEVNIGEEASKTGGLPRTAVGPAGYGSGPASSAG